MAYDLEEQEQLETIKAWWKRYGQYVSIVTALVIVGILGYQAWNYYVFQQSSKASERFETLSRLGYEDEKDLKQIRSIATDLIETYSSTAYAGRAAIAVAKANLQAKDTKSAETQLKWAADHAKESAIRSIALLQLAGLQLEQKSYETALKTLQEKHDIGYEGLFSDMRGDIYLAQGKRAEAKKAYQSALEKLEAGGRYYRYTAYKLESLGG